MKKHLIKIMFIAVVAAVGYSAYNSQKEVGLSDLALNNIEALARSEGGSSDCNTYCTPASGYTCIILWPGAEGITCNSHKKK